MSDETGWETSEEAERWSEQAREGDVKEREHDEAERESENKTEDTAGTVPLLAQQGITTSVPHSYKCLFPCCHTYVTLSSIQPHCTSHQLDWVVSINLV